MSNSRKYSTVYHIAVYVISHTHMVDLKPTVGPISIVDLIPTVYPIAIAIVYPIPMVNPMHNDKQETRSNYVDVNLTLFSHLSDRPWAPRWPRSTRLCVPGRGRAMNKGKIDNSEGLAEHLCALNHLKAAVLGARIVDE